MEINVSFYRQRFQDTKKKKRELKTVKSDARASANKADEYSDLTRIKSNGFASIVFTDLACLSPMELHNFCLRQNTPSQKNQGRNVLLPRT